MSEMTTLSAEQSIKIIQVAVRQRIPAIMSYLSKGKWHAAKLQLVGLTGDRLSVESADPVNNRRPVNIQVNQPVGVSFKHDFGKYVFETTVLAFEQSALSRPGSDFGGAIVLAMPA